MNEPCFDAINHLIVSSEMDTSESVNLVCPLLRPVVPPSSLVNAVYCHVVVSGGNNH